jgi:hypothetical protein
LAFKNLIRWSQRKSLDTMSRFSVQASSRRAFWLILTRWTPLCHSTSSNLLSMMKIKITSTSCILRMPNHFHYLWWWRIEILIITWMSTREFSRALVESRLERRQSYSMTFFMVSLEKLRPRILKRTLLRSR